MSTSAVLLPVTASGQCFLINFSMALFGTGYDASKGQERTSLKQYFSSADGTAFTGPFQLQKTFINGTLRYGGTGRSSHHVSKGLERTSLQPYFSSCALSPPTRQRLRGRSTCKRHSSIINGTLRYGGAGRSSHDVSKGLERTSLQQFFLPCAFSPPTRQRFRGVPGAEDIHQWHFAVRGTERGLLVPLRRLLQFSFPSGVPKGASSFVFVDFCIAHWHKADR